MRLNTHHGPSGHIAAATASTRAKCLNATDSPAGAAAALTCVNSAAADSGHISPH